MGQKVIKKTVSPTIRWPVPLKLRGTPFIIKGPAHLVIPRMPEMGFWQKIFKKVVFLDLDSSKFNSLRQYRAYYS